MRISLAADLESRDGTVTKDAKVTNAVIEQKSDIEWEVIKRPGMSDLGSIRSGTAQMLAYFNSQVISVQANNADRTALPFATNSIGSVGSGTISQITRSGSTATILFSAANAPGIMVGDSITVSGCTQPEYNITATVTAVTISAGVSVSVSYTVAGAPASPATGSPVVVLNTARQFTYDDNGLGGTATGYLVIQQAAIAWRIKNDWTLTKLTDTDLPFNQNPPAYLVPGVVFMDGYFFLMDVTRRIYNSALDADPTTWAATDFITAERVSGAGVALTSSLNYVIALKEWSTEPFYDAGNATGSPLAPVDNGHTDIGCASANSVAKLHDNVFWMAKARQKGRSVYMMRGIQQKKVSTDDIDKILNADDLATVYAYGLSILGHDLYVLTLVTSNITLVYDMTAQKWTQWSSYSTGSVVGITSIIRSGTTATVTASGAHGLSDGDPVFISGAGQAAYNGYFQVQYVSATVFTIQVVGSPATPATGSISMANFTESYWKFTKYVNANGRDVFLHESDGHLYEMLTSSYFDAANPINCFNRTTRLDGGNLDMKKMGAIAVVGDRLSDTIMVRWSDDDSTSFSAYANIDLSKDQPRRRRCGSFRRRSLETRYLGNNPLRLTSLELEISK